MKKKVKTNMHTNAIILYAENKHKNNVPQHAIPRHELYITHHFNEQTYGGRGGGEPTKYTDMFSNNKSQPRRKTTTKTTLTEQKPNKAHTYIHIYIYMYIERQS